MSWERACGLGGDLVVSGWAWARVGKGKGSLYSKLYEYFCKSYLPTLPSYFLVDSMKPAQITIWAVLVVVVVVVVVILV